MHLSIMKKAAPEGGLCPVFGLFEKAQSAVSTSGPPTAIAVAAAARRWTDWR